MSLFQSPFIPEGLSFFKYPDMTSYYHTKSLENFITLQLSLTTISPYPAGTQIDVYKPCIKQMQTVLGPVN
ncbi:MAG: hypothetical protein N0E38_15685, partial [Candidatus Thiodiazotropha endolucinida]|nr:hypothetical protein [Candidatus Thiodiazotropha taylori]MCW4350374.1 hypothetical protein [Candidatus Thiodiazotropha endolucinida]